MNPVDISPNTVKFSVSIILLSSCFALALIQNTLIMKNKHIAHAHESAKIYRHYYKPSLNIFRLLKSVLLVFISGSSAAAGNFARRK